MKTYYNNSTVIIYSKVDSAKRLIIVIPSLNLTPVKNWLYKTFCVCDSTLPSNF